MIGANQSMGKLSSQKGLSLIEVLISMSLFVILAGGIYFSYANVLEVLSRTRLRTLAVSLLNKEVEIIRNLPYDDVGVVGGFPPGVIAAEKAVLFEGQNFVIRAFVRNEDDPFDGVLGGEPNDTAPADRRIVQLEVSCQGCSDLIKPISFTTWVSPENLESSTQNGSLFINVFDASGVPISGANVSVVNNTTTPTISISDTTNNSGTLQLVDIPTSTNAYEITITKSGYTSAKTYTPGDSANPNPIQPHSTVASQQITEISFSIDKVSTINAKTQDYFCSGIGSADFDYEGIRLIGAGPDVLKNTGTFTTDSSGLKTLSSVEWDTYSFFNKSSAYHFVGSIPNTPLVVDPNTTYSLGLTLAPATTTAILVEVSASSGLPISDASVNIFKTGVDVTKNTGVYVFSESDWSNSNYSSQDGNIEDNSPAGEIKLKQVLGAYPTSTNSYLISNTIDFGSASTSLRFISWLPTSQPSQTGANSLQFQLASNNDNSTWNFIGPDGTASTYFTASSTIGSAHNDKRYLRYKAFLNTLDSGYTPSLSEIFIEFSSGCVPAGHAYFAPAPTGTYTVTVSKSGFQTATSSVSVSSGLVEKEFILIE